jgi:two-component system, cell cycle sensor histidine kinase and response regulator CckA
MMDDTEKTKGQLIKELADLRRRIHELEALGKNLSTSEERYRDFVENVEDHCFETDLAGNMTFANEAACLRLGYASREDLLGMNNRQYSTPQQAKKIAKVFEEVYRTGIPAKSVDYEVMDANGKTLYMQMSVSLIRDAAGNPKGFRGVAQDVSDRKKADLERERYRDIIESIEDGCFEMDMAGYATFTNEAAQRIMGYSHEELRCMKLTAYSKPEEAERILSIYNDMYRTGHPVKMYQHEIIRKDGEVRILEASASLIRDESGTPIGFRGVYRDVTDRKKMEEEQKILTKQFQQSQKMEAVGTLAGGIAHDFNNLLMGILGHASLMLLDIGPSHPYYERLKTIEDQIKSGAALTKQLLGFARGGRYEAKPTDLNELISRTTTMFGRTKKEIRIYEKYTPRLWATVVDRGQIEQVLLNLYVNAWQAMPGGGELYLETGNVMLDESYVKAYQIAPGPYVKVSITDTGVGMDEKTKTRIFEPFFTTKEMGRGTGLGLASSYGIIKGHDGLINVYSEKGHGTTFNIYLPASDKELVRQEQVAPEVLKGSETILIVDDERIIVDVTKEMLKGMGYRILTAGSGEEAIEIYRSNKDRIDLVIMDMIMPGIGGGNAFDAIFTMNPGVKVILSSGYSLNGEAKHIMQRGVRAFLQKPFHFNDLSQKVREALSQVF